MTSDTCRYRRIRTRRVNVMFGRHLVSSQRENALTVDLIQRQPYPRRVQLHPALAHDAGVDAVVDPPMMDDLPPQRPDQQVVLDRRHTEVIRQLSTGIKARCVGDTTSTITTGFGAAMASSGIGGPQLTSAFGS